MKIVLTGSVAYDYIMSFPGYFKDHILVDRLDTISLSFLVESMTVLRGGVAPNIAYNLALLRIKPYLMATVGEDFGEYRNWLESKGIDTSMVKVIPGTFTASFFANTDRANAQIASFYPGAMACASQLSFTDLKEELPDLVVVSPNDPAAMNKYVEECTQLDIPYIYDPSQQIVRLNDQEIRAGIRGAKAIFVNDYEFGLIEKVTGMDTRAILECVKFMVVTCGEKGAKVYQGQELWKIPAIPPQKIADPTGVGDAFRGGFLVGYLRGLDLETCGRMGALAATCCLEHAGPQGHSYTPAEFVARYRQTFDDQGRLDLLLEDERSG